MNDQRSMGEPVTITVDRGVLGYSLALLEREAERAGPNNNFLVLDNKLRAALGCQPYEEYRNAQSSESTNEVLALDVHEAESAEGLEAR